ncbi:MAG: YggS family pyridoxal phosphate-dependent enzyme [Spirochaetaceae bacterium]|jgi:pyridoxal phosphate enzyme (YggS family)|nr:YggS family pyridoxal phosphate-dependent enzyme [Spirochaetaceae bacterium]
MMEIIQNIARIREQIQDACLRAGRNPEEIQLMGVSKFQEISKIEEAWSGGIRLFGESRVQEGVEKFTDFKRSHPDLELHLIGALQRNKAKTAGAFFDAIQSVDRDALIDTLGTAAVRPLNILLELRTGEETKTGFPDLESLFRGAEKIESYPLLKVKGLMTIAPYTGDPRRIREAFRAVASARNKLEARFPAYDWSCLSMGMSGDFETAIEEGATLLRIGTALFGSRQ